MFILARQLRRANGEFEVVDRGLQDLLHALLLTLFALVVVHGARGLCGSRAAAAGRARGCSVVGQHLAEAVDGGIGFATLVVEDGRSRLMTPGR